METPYEQAASVLSGPLRQPALEVDEQTRQRVEEFRLRLSLPMMLTRDGGEYPLETPPVTEGDLRGVLERASRCSVHAVLDQMRAGFVTIRGGHRIGLCGQAVMREGKIHALDRLTSLAIRIARQHSGVGREALAGIVSEDKPCSTLILAPPGAGKTTLLRELVRRLSDGVGIPSRRVGLVDERGEVAACWEGVPQFNVGRRTDIMSGCPKETGIAILVRGMAPEVLAVDEVTVGEDIDAMAWATGCGVILLATAHGSGREDLRRRPLYRKLLELGIFQKLLLLQNGAGVRSVQVEALA